jgi:hypothetical protein
MTTTEEGIEKQLFQAAKHDDTVAHSITIAHETVPVGRVIASRAR